MSPPLTPTARIRLLVISCEVRKRLGLTCESLSPQSFDELVDRVALVQLKFEGLVHCW